MGTPSPSGGKKERLEQLDLLLNEQVNKQLRLYKLSTFCLTALSTCLAGYVVHGAVTKPSEPQPSDFMVVHNIVVPNHKVGEDPKITYHRTVRRPFRAAWTVELREYENANRVNYCRTGGGMDTYEVGETYEPMRLGFYSGWKSKEDCPMRPGCYFLSSTWHILRADGLEITPIFNRSTKFCVTPASP